MLSFNPPGPGPSCTKKLQTTPEESQFLEEREDISHFLNIIFLLMHFDVLLAFLGSKCYPADSLPTSPRLSCSAPENGIGWEGPEIILSGEMFKGTGTLCG